MSSNSDAALAALVSQFPMLPPDTLGAVLTMCGGDVREATRQLQFLLMQAAGPKSKWDGNAPNGSPMSQIGFCGSYGSSCGYCKQDEDTRAAYGINTKVLTVADYQALIDRGWRRSGTFTYKPNNKDGCCPQYTIRLDVTKFKLTKKLRHRRNKFERYLRGEKIAGSPEASASSMQNSDEKEEPQELQPRVLTVTQVKAVFDKEAFEVYKKYQTSVHKDNPEELTEKQYSRFLCNSPLVADDPHFGMLSRFLSCLLPGAVGGGGGGDLVSPRVEARGWKVHGM